MESSSAYSSHTPPANIFEDDYESCVEDPHDLDLIEEGKLLVRKRESIRHHQPLFLQPPLNISTRRATDNGNSCQSSSTGSSLERVDERELDSVAGPSHDDETKRKSSGDRTESPIILHREQSFAIQELLTQNVMLQLNEQLFLLSRQLQSLENNNHLQLRILVRMLSRLVKPRRSPLSYFMQGFRMLPFFLIAICWPFVARGIYRWWLRRRYAITQVFLKYL